MSLKEEKSSLLQLIKEKALFCQPVKLSSGKKSSYYVDGRQITLSAKGAYLVAKLIFPMIKDDNLGADPILGAVICWSHLENFPLQGFIVRKEPKKHGMQRYIEGPALKKGTRVAIIDDVVTTGESVLRSARAVEELGCRVVRIICLVDRLEGAGERLKKYGYKLTPLFTRNDLELLE